MYRAALFVVLGLAAGCKKESKAPPAPSATTVEGTAPSPLTTTPSVVTQASADEAHNMFKTVCAVCHGESGMGNGPGAANLDPKPRNYTDKTWQASVTDEQIKNTILMGGAAVGKSPLMPAQPQLREKPEVLAELVRIIRSFGK